MQLLGIDEEPKIVTPQPVEDMAVVAKSESSDFDDEEEGGQWITQENLYSNIGGAAGDLLQNNDNEMFKVNKPLEPLEGEE